VLCVGAVISYALNKRFQGLKELIRVLKKDGVLMIQCHSKLGMIRNRLRKGLLDEAIEIYKTSICVDGIGVKAYLYTLDEMSKLFEEYGCRVLEIASTPTFTDTFDNSLYNHNQDKWNILKKLELKLCTAPELLGMGHSLLFIAKKK